MTGIHFLGCVLGVLHLASSGTADPIIGSRENDEDSTSGVLPNCGKSVTYRRPKIVGGRDALIGEFPWQLSLEMQLVPLFTDFQHICGASLLNSKWAITAAHCIAGGYFSSYRVIAGTDTISTRDSSHRSTHDVMPIVHERYNPTLSMKYDIAMLRLETPVDLEKADGYVNGVCLPPASAANNLTGIATVTGWGTTSQGGALSSKLQAVDVPLISDEKCREAYGADMIDDTMICAGYEEGGKDSCQGDSGGPLVQRNDQDAAALIGIVSFGRGCAQPGYPGVYTETAFFLDWIARVMERGTPVPLATPAQNSPIYVF